MQQNQTIKPREVNVQEKDVFVHPANKQDLDGIVANMTNAEVFGKEMGYRGILFTGPPGTGKTLTAQLVATKTTAQFIDAGKIGTIEQVKELYETARKYRDESEKSGKKQPVIIFIDEIDRFSSRENIVDPMQAATLNQLLMQLDGTENNYKIFTFGATNQQDKIDPALRRPKRFGKEISFLPPDEKGRLEILDIHAYKKDHKFKLEKKDLEEIAKVTYGYTGADLVGLLTEAFTHANLEKRTKVNYSDLEYALGKSTPSALRDMPHREPKKTFSDLGGYEDHKELIKKVMETSKQNLFLFFGPSGTGKSVFAEAMAKEKGYNFIVVEGSSLIDPFVGQTGKNIDKVLTRAKQLAPCLILFDEFGSLVESKGYMGYKDTWTGLLQSKLTQPIDGVYIVATENNPERLTDQVLQRFQYPIYFGLPASAEGYVKIWEKYISKEEAEKNKLDLTRLATLSQAAEHSGRHVEQIAKRVREYGFMQSQEVYEKLIERTPNDPKDYTSVIEKIGDRVKEYREMKEILAEINAGKDKEGGKKEVEKK